MVVNNIQNSFNESKEYKLLSEFMKNNTAELQQYIISAKVVESIAWRMYEMHRGAVMPRKYSLGTDNFKALQTIYRIQEPEWFESMVWYLRYPANLAHFEFCYRHCEGALHWRKRFLLYVWREYAWFNVRYCLTWIRDTQRFTMFIFHVIALLFAFYLYMRANSSYSEDTMEVRGSAYKRASNVNANGDSQCDNQSEKNNLMNNLMYNNNYNYNNSKKWRVNNNNDPLNKNGNMFAANSGGGGNNYNNTINGKSKQRNH